MAAVNLGVEVHDPWRAVWLFSVGGAHVPDLAGGGDRGTDLALLREIPMAKIKVVKEDQTMRIMREFGFTGPISREDYLNFIHASDDEQPLDAEMESLLPEHLQAWELFHATKH
jgi:hypothetical protein